MNDVGFFVSLMSRVWRELFSTLDKVVATIKAFHQINEEVLTRVRQSVFKGYQKMLGALGGDDFKVKVHNTRAKQRQKGRGACRPD